MSQSHFFKEASTGGLALRKFCKAHVPGLQASWQDWVSRCCYTTFLCGVPVTGSAECGNAAATVVRVVDKDTVSLSNGPPFQWVLWYTAVEQLLAH